LKEELRRKKEGKKKRAREESTSVMNVVSPKAMEKKLR
jgi:hypothetical protein